MKTLRNTFAGTGRGLTAGLLTIVMTFMFLSPSLVVASSVAGDKGKEDKPTAKENETKLKAGLMDDFRNKDGRKEFTPEELEQMRSALLDLLNIGHDVYMLKLNRTENNDESDAQSRMEDYESTKEQIQKMSEKDLTVLRTVLDPLKIMGRLAKLRASISSYKDRVTTKNSSTAAADGFPEAAPFCEPPTTQEYKDALIALLAAEAARDIAQNGCNEVIVALGFGGNGRLACLITDAIYVGIRAGSFDTRFCYEDYTGVLAGANYARLEHLHGDLEAVGSSNTENFNNVRETLLTNTTTLLNNIGAQTLNILSNNATNTSNILNSLNTSTTTLSTAVTNAENNIVNNDNTNTTTLNTSITNAKTELNTAITNTKNELNTSITNAKTEIVNNSNDNTTNIVNNANQNALTLNTNLTNAKNTIVNNDNTNTTTILNTGNTNTGNIIANDNQNTTNILNNAAANTTALTDALLRSQIEADLATESNGVKVGWYMTPTANGGKLDLVQQIVTLTLANIVAAGGSIGNAQSFLDQANADKAAGNFKSAYDNYRKAYKAAVN